MSASRVASTRPRATRPPHPLEWLVDPVREDPGFELKAWFGGRSLMLDGMHRLFLTTQGEPWQGVLVCTDYPHHEALRAELPALTSHPVLKKWLYLPEAAESFETDARRLVALARARDPRLGVAPSPRKKKGEARRKVRFGDAL